MSVNKGLEMYTKLNTSYESYLKKIESYVGKIDCIVPVKGAVWGYDDHISIQESADYVSKQPVKAKLFVGLKSGISFYLDVHNRDGKPVIAELSDSGSDKNTYEALFTPYFKMAKNLGNTVCYMSSENKNDAQFRFMGFDKKGKTIGKPVLNDFGQNIGEKAAVDAYAKKELGLSVVRYIVRVPEVYLVVSRKDYDEKMKGFVEFCDRQEEHKLSNHYSIAYFDKEKNEYHKIAEASIPMDIVVSKDFEKNLSALVGKEDFQQKIFESASTLDEYYQNYRTNDFATNDRLKTKGYAIQEELQNECNFLFFKDLEKQRQQERNAGKALSSNQQKLAFAIEKWAAENDKRDKNGYLLSLNRKASNKQAALNLLVKQAKEEGFVLKEKKSENTK